MDDVYAINLAKTILREGYNEGDPERILSVYDDAFADMSYGMPSFYYSDAKEVFRARLNRLFSDYTVSMNVLIIDVVLNGDRAFDWGWHILNLTAKGDGAGLQVRTRYFETWRQDAKRGWLITSLSITWISLRDCRSSGSKKSRPAGIAAWLPACLAIFHNSPLQR